MESSQAQPKQQKGLRKVWAKIKAVIRLQSTSSKTPTAAASSPAVTSPPAAATNTTTPPPPQTHDSLPAPTENTTQAEPVQSTPTQPAQPVIAQPAAEQPTNKPSHMSDIIEVDDEEIDDQEFADIRYYTGTSDQTSGAGHSSSFARDPTTQRMEIAQDIYSRYNMAFDPAQFRAHARPTVERVEKKPRMRVRWTCHECQSTFGRDKHCPNCTHSRCRECIRYPPKKPGDKANKMLAKTPLEVPVVEKPTTGACHACKTRFDFPAAQCSNCGHQICDRCIEETVQEAPITTAVAATS